MKHTSDYVILPSLVLVVVSVWSKRMINKSGEVGECSHENN